MEKGERRLSTFSMLLRSPLHFLLSHSHSPASHSDLKRWGRGQDAWHLHAWHLDAPLRFRPVRPVPSARGETPGYELGGCLRPVRAALSKSQATRCLGAGNLWTRRGTGVAAGDWLRCTGNVTVPSTTSTHPPAPASASACLPGISRNLLRTALTGRRARGVVLIWHFMPGWWNWPYRPKTQGSSAGRMEGRIIRGWRSDCGPIGQRYRCHAPQGRCGLCFLATAHLIFQVSATAGTVPGNGAVVATSVDSSDCDDSIVQPTAAVARPRRARGDCPRCRTK